MSFTNHFPNIDLHCHLDGSLPLLTMESILQRSLSPNQIQVTPQCDSLAQYLEYFHIPLECLQTEIGLELASYGFMQSLVSDRISYIEVRFAPLLSTIHGLTGEQVIDAVTRGLDRGKEAFQIDYKIILCMMRHHPFSLNLEVLKLAKSYLNRNVCAVDLAGSEAQYPIALFRRLFLQASVWNIPYTIHAGECGSVDNVIEAIELGATRIGHGIALQGHAEAIQLCREKNVAIELCPTSNLQTNACSNIADYPLREFLDAGLLVTINTDNRTVSNTTIEHEFQFIKEHCGITDAECGILKFNAMKARF